MSGFVSAPESFTADGAYGIIHGGPTGLCHSFGVSVVRTVGTTDVVDVDLYGSNDGTTFIKIGDPAITVAGGIAYSSVIDKPIAFVRVLVVTVGAGNTLLIQIAATP